MANFLVPSAFAKNKTPALNAARVHTGANPIRVAIVLSEKLHRNGSVTICSVNTLLLSSTDSSILQRHAPEPPPDGLLLIHGRCAAK
jgi:hypothetical protein